MEQRLRDLEKTCIAQTDAIRVAAQRSALMAEESTAGVAATVAKIAAEKDFEVAEARAEARRVAEGAAATAAAAVTAAGSTEVEVSALKEEVEQLRRQLESAPLELRAEWQTEFDEKEERVREEVRTAAGCERVLEVVWAGEYIYTKYIFIYIIICTYLALIFCTVCIKVGKNLRVER